MRRLILLLLLLAAVGGAQNITFYTDRAVGTFPVGSGSAKITALIPIQYGQVRVCGLPLTQQSPCLPLAAITDLSNNQLTVQGGNFGQLTTDVVGRFSFGCVAATNLQVQVAPGSSNVPQLNYPITCPGPNPTVTLVPSMACDDTTDDTAALQAAINTLANGNGGNIFIPPSANGCKISSAAITIPVDSTNPIHRQKTIKLMGAAGGANVVGGIGGIAACLGGSQLDMTFNAPTAKIITLGQGNLIITDICFKDSGTDNAPLLLTTNTSMAIHHNGFVMNCTAPSNDLFLIGGQDTSPGNVVTSDSQGISIIDDNWAICYGRFAFLRNTANAQKITNNHLGTPTSSSTLNVYAIELQPSSNNNGNNISNNIIETAFRLGGIHAFNGSSFNAFTDNSCYDATAATVACVKVDSGSFSNIITEMNVNQNGSFPALSTIFQPGNFYLSPTCNVATFPCVAGFTTVMQGINLIGAGSNKVVSGNNVTLLCPDSNPAAITGNGAAQTFFSCTIPGNTVGPGKSFRVWVDWLHQAGAALITYNCSLGGTTLTGNFNQTDSNKIERAHWEISNNVGVQNAQHGTLELWLGGTANGVSNLPGSTAVNMAVDEVFSCTFNVANTDAVQLTHGIIELIQ